MKTLHRPNDQMLAYRDDGNGTPILCVHGWGANGSFFTTDLVEAGFRVIRPDLRGHGASSAYTEGATFCELSQDLAALIVALDLKNVIVVGWSLGAMVAWDLALSEAQDRLAGLITIDMTARMLNTDRWELGLRAGEDHRVFWRSLQAMRSDWPSFTSVFLPRIVARGREAEFSDLLAVLSGFARQNDAQSMARLWSDLVELDYRTRITQINLPCMVAYGGKSQLYSPAVSQWVAEHIPNAITHEFPEAGHAPHLECPDEFNRVVRTFSGRALSAANDQTAHQTRGRRN